MVRCKKCPYHCRPCLEIPEAEAILADDGRRTFNGNDICQECRLKSNRSQNRWTYKKAGREFEGEDETSLEKKIAQLQAQLKALGIEV